jgi:hypothetical protein
MTKREASRPRLSVLDDLIDAIDIPRDMPEELQKKGPEDLQAWPPS